MRAFFPLAVLAAVRVHGSVDVLSFLDRCRSGRFEDCLARDLAAAVDGLMDKNETYRLNRYLTVTVVAPPGNRSAADRSHGNRLGTRLLDFFNALTVRYQPEEIDDVFEGTTITDDVFEGRKKMKNKANKKHKMSMMMAGASMGMTVVGWMVSKMMMGGVMIIAMKALIIAKIALVLAGAMAIKKVVGGGIGGGGGSIQPMWVNGGGGGSEQSGGYRRSYTDTEQNLSTNAGELAYREQLGSYNNAYHSQFSK